MPAFVGEQRITFRVSQAAFDEFRHKAWRQHCSRPSEMLRVLIGQFLDNPLPNKSVAAIASIKSSNAQPLPPAKRLGRRPRHISTYVTSVEYQEIRAIAASYGGVASWVRGALDARLGKSTELPALEEVKALYAATTELWNVGRNLNQVARHMNGAKRVGMPVSTDALRPELVAKLARSVDRLAERTDAIISAAKRRGFGRE